MATAVLGALTLITAEFAVALASTLAAFILLFKRGLRRKLLID